MRGRAFVLKGESAGWDLEKESSGRFSCDPMQMWARHEEIRSWVAGLDDATAEPVRPEDLDAGAGSPGHHRDRPQLRGARPETGFEPPTELPPVFAKFPSSITGAHGEVGAP